jgi:hypothetical protein
LPEGRRPIEDVTVAFVTRAKLPIREDQDRCPVSDFFNLRKAFSADFRTHHVFILDNDPEAVEQAKKRAEVVFQSRGVSVNSILCLKPAQVFQIVMEVQKRQSEFQQKLQQWEQDGRKKEERPLFLSEWPYVYFVRQGKRATLKGPARLWFGAAFEDGEYKISHLDPKTFP